MTTGAKHGQSSILNCNGAYTPTGNFECYDGLDTTSPACEVQLQVLVRWPLPDTSVVSSIGAICIQPDLQISLVDSTGKVRVTAKSGFDCVPRGGPAGDAGDRPEGRRDRGRGEALRPPPGPGARLHLRHHLRAGGGGPHRGRLRLFPGPRWGLRGLPAVAAAPDAERRGLVHEGHREGALPHQGHGEVHCDARGGHNTFEELRERPGPHLPARSRSRPSSPERTTGCSAPRPPPRASRWSCSR